MKKIFLVINLLSISALSYSQSAYYGALYLNSVDSNFLIKVMNVEKLKDSDITNVIYYSSHEKQQLRFLNTFLKNPFSQNISTLDYNIIQSAFDKYYQTVKIQLLYDLDISAQPSKVFGFSLQPFKNITPAVIYETNLNDANIKLYYATPFRQKQTIDYMAAFKEAGRTNGELRIFFPETFKKIKYAEQNQQFPDFGNVLKKLFSQDLKNVFDNLFNYIENYPLNAIPDIETSFLKERNIASIKNNDNYFPFKLSVETIDKVTNGYNPVSLINILDKKYYSPKVLSKSQKTVKDRISIALHGLNLIQSALRDTISSYKRKANLWISFEQLNELKLNEARYFAGLIYQKDIKYFNTLYNFTSSTPENVIIETIEPMVNAVLEQTTAIQEFINTNPGKGKMENHFKFLLLNYNLITNNIFIPTDLKQYFNNGLDIIAIYDNVHNHTYNTSMYYTLKVLNELQQTKPEFTHEMHIINNYANFLSDIVNCNNSEQLKNVITTYVPKK